jgi:hypothetical protein
MASEEVCRRIRMRMEDFSKEDAPYLEHGMAAKAEKAQRWIQANRTALDGKFWEDVVPEYPGDPRALMFAWCEEFGGI